MTPAPSRIAAQTCVGIQQQTLKAKRQPKYRPGEDLLGRVSALCTAFSAS
jgi:hypothetical protein